MPKVWLVVCLPLESLKACLMFPGSDCPSSALADLIGVYDFGAYTRFTLRRLLAKSQEWDVPFFLGEFGVFHGRYANRFAADMYRFLDTHFLSGCQVSWHRCSSLYSRSCSKRGCSSWTRLAFTPARTKDSGPCIHSPKHACWSCKVLPAACPYACQRCLLASLLSLRVWINSFACIWGLASLLAWCHGSHLL